VLVPTSAVLAAARDVPDPAIERYGSSTKAKATVHVVKRGESLERIANRYHTNVSTLKRLNHLSKTSVKPGQVLVVKGAGSSTRAAAKSSRSKASTSAARVKTASRKSTLTGSTSKRATVKPPAAKKSAKKKRG
jgi:membrane-bound lytic murein transglycosylase D